MENELENNIVKIGGRLASAIEFSHEVYDEKFYKFYIETNRLSNYSDKLPVIISERIIDLDSLNVGDLIHITGQFRSYNCYQGEKNRLILTVFAKQVDFVENQEEDIQVGKDITTNEVVLDGYICKKPIYRKTPFGREIADILLAVNRSYNKSDYIPCIAWGRNAKFCETVPVGAEIRVIGRVQSREYEKKYEDGTVEKRIAYEVSASSLEIINKNEDENLEEIEEAQENKEAI